MSLPNKAAYDIFCQDVSRGMKFYNNKQTTKIITISTAKRSVVSLRFSSHPPSLHYTARGRE